MSEKSAGLNDDESERWTPERIARRDQLIRAQAAGKEWVRRLVAVTQGGSKLSLMITKTEAEGVNMDFLRSDLQGRIGDRQLDIVISETE